MASLAARMRPRSMPATTPVVIGTPTVESADTTVKSEAPTPTIVTKARISHPEAAGGFPIRLLETLVNIICLI